MRTRAGVIAVLMALVVTGCAEQEPAALPGRTAPLVLPDGYADPPVTPTPVEQCATPEGRAEFDPYRTFNPAKLARDGAGRPTGPTLDAIRADGQLVVGVSQTTPLLSRRDQVTGRMEGYEIDIINRIARELFGEPLGPDDPRLHLVTMPTGSRLLALNTGKNRAVRGSDPKLGEIPEVDMVLADVTLTCNRVYTHDIVYSTPYIPTNAGILTRRGPDGTPQVGSLHDLRDQKVCAASATTSIADLAAARQSTGIVPVSVPDSSECLMLLQRGLVSAIYTDYPILQGLQMQDPGTQVIDLRGVGVGAGGVAMSSEHEDLVRFVNGVLEAMRQDGTLEASRKRWFVDELAGFGDDRVPLLPLLPLPEVRYVD